MRVRLSHIIVAGALLCLNLHAAVVGASTAAASLTMQRVVGLPEAVRGPWVEYVGHSTWERDIEHELVRRRLEAAGVKEATVPPSGSSARGLPLDRPAEWYGSAEARRVADIVVSFQTPPGGWSKNLDLTDHVRRPNEGYAPDNLSRFLGPDDFDTPQDAHWNYFGTLDNDATTTELRYLSKVISATAAREGGRYRAAFELGLEYLLAAQFPNGGWPQVWPLEGGYHDAITFNDGAVTETLELLRDVGAGKPDLAFVPPAMRQRAAAGVARGVECILAAQIVAQGHWTVWGQQHDALTLQPVAGRNYEPAAQCSAESAGLEQFLMSLENPDEAVVAAVDAAVAWFRKTALRDVAYGNGPDGRRLTPSPGSGPLWARFYAVGTEMPVFGDRDKSIHDDVSEISRERRQGYSWYNSAPQAVLERYTPWRAEHAGKSRPAR